MATLLEQYKSRLAVADKVYAQTHNGQRLSESKKLTTAKCLDNINKFINEAFNNSVGTQRSDLGMWKKFSMNLTNVALPNLIAHDLVIVQPMSSMSGYVTYIKYTAGSNKGATEQGKPLMSPFALGKVDPDYTSARVVETITEGMTKVAWGPVVVSTMTHKKDGTCESVNLFKFLDAEGNVLAGGTMNEDGTFTAPEGAVKVAYVYNNVVIPQNDIPVVNAEIDAIPLIAKARRIAVYYSQIAAFQAKTDYGIDLGDQLAEKAVGELSYEIDTEITNLLCDHAEESSELVWSRTLPIGVSKTEHYEGFSEIVSIASQIIYDRTQKFAPNYMLIASDVLPILKFVRGFSGAPAGTINGPYFAGTFDNLKVFVTPNIEAGKFVIGVNGDDMMSSAAVYAPYMAIVPTQLLQYADGGTSQGWSTLYDLKPLSTYTGKDGKEYSRLLVSGKIVK